MVSALAAAPLPQRLAADVDDAYALRFNPAGLGFLDGTELRAAVGREQRWDDGGSTGLAVYWAASIFDTVAFGLSREQDWLPDSVESAETRVGVGIQRGGLGIGAAFRRADLTGAESVDGWDFGLTWRLSRWFSLATTFTDVTDAVVGRSYGVSLATRPGWDRLLLGVSAATAPRVDDGFDFGARLEIELVRGIRAGLGAQARRLPGGFEAVGVLTQVAVDFGRVSTGGFLNSVEPGVQFAAEVAVRSEPRARVLASSSVVVAQLGGDLTPGPDFYLLRGEAELRPYGTAPRAIAALAYADQVPSVQLTFGRLTIGWANAEELRRALQTVRKAGRPVDCVLGAANDITYFVASACSRLVALPPTVLRFDGLATTQIYLGEALDRLGVAVEVERIGAYKNAPDSFTRSGMSEEERDRLGRYLDTVDAARVGMIAEGRGMSEVAVRAGIDRGVLTATEALAGGFIDAVVWPDEIDEHFYGRSQSKQSVFHALTATPPVKSWRPEDGSMVAVVHVDAPITGGASSASPLGLGRTVGALDLLAALERCEREARIKAVVLRVDSPGGDAGASELVARAVSRLAQKKPVVASFGNVAASGGYYVAAPATRIFAEPTTLTGSIGIYLLELDLSRLLGRLGVGVEVLGRGALSGASNSFTPLTPAARARLRSALGDSYRRFLEVVAAGRGRPVEEIEPLAEGRVWSGRDALGVGLVDELGGLGEAILYASRAAGRDPGELDLLQLPEKAAIDLGPLSGLRLFRAASGAPSQDGVNPKIGYVGAAAALGSMLGPAAAAVDARLPLWTSGQPLALLPWVVEVK